MSSTGSSVHPGDLSDRRRVLGARHLVFFVVAAAAPLAFSLGAIPLAIGRGGIGTVAAFVVTGVILMIFAVGYLAMAGHLRRAGGLNELVSAGLGRIPGVGAAFVAVTAYACAATGAVGVFAVFANVAADDLLGIDVPWTVWAVVGTVLMGVLGLLQVEANARVLGVIICLEVGILLIVAFAIVIEGGAQGLSAEALAPSSIFAGHPGAMFAVTISAFAGFEATVIYSDEVKDRTRTLRRATLSVIVVMALLYGFVTWALIQAYGNTEAADIANLDPTTMFLSATETYVGTWAVRTLEILVVASWFASMVAFHNATARYLSTMGKDRIVPLKLAAIHSRFGSPWCASLTHRLHPCRRGRVRDAARRPLSGPVHPGQLPRSRRNSGTRSAGQCRHHRVFPARPSRTFTYGSPCRPGNRDDSSHGDRDLDRHSDRPVHCPARNSGHCHSRGHRRRLRRRDAAGTSYVAHRAHSLYRHHHLTLTPW